MVNIKNNEGPKKVPLVYYDETGERHVVGDAAVEIKNGEVIALGQINSGLGDIFASGMSLEAFSISNHEATISPVQEASERLGVLRIDPKNKPHRTDTNPNGEVDRCDRRDIHGPHEWQREFGAYFNVYCPGNKGDKR